MLTGFSRVSFRLAHILSRPSWRHSASRYPIWSISFKVSNGCLGRTVRTVYSWTPIVFRECSSAAARARTPLAETPAAVLRNLRLEKCLMHLIMHPYPQRLVSGTTNALEKVET